MDIVKIDDLPQRFEALAFMLPDEEPPFFGNDLVEVTREAAATVSGIFRSMVERGVGRLEAQRFVLQSVVAMFAEDAGLLPSHFFTRTVRTDARNGREAYDLLGSLFREMNTPGRTSGGRFEGTQYFNGGLFAEIQPIEMTQAELEAMRGACQTNWAPVRREIFGTLLERQARKAGRGAATSCRQLPPEHSDCGARLLTGAARTDETRRRASSEVPRTVFASSAKRSD
jgi:hypothetical protein